MAQNKAERCVWTLGKATILISKTMGWKQRPDLNPISGDLQEQWKGICRKEVDTSEFIAVKQDREAFVFSIGCRRTQWNPPL